MVLGGASRDYTVEDAALRRAAKRTSLRIAECVASADSPAPARSLLRPVQVVLEELVEDLTLEDLALRHAAEQASLQLASVVALLEPQGDGRPSAALPPIDLGSVLERWRQWARRLHRRLDIQLSLPEAPVGVRANGNVLQSVFEAAFNLRGAAYPVRVAVRAHQGRAFAELVSAAPVWPVAVTSRAEDPHTTEALPDATQERRALELAVAKRRLAPLGGRLVVTHDPEFRVLVHLPLA